jgi:hypothetical protein
MKQSASLKRCVDCKEEKELSEFKDRPNVNKTKTKYKSSICRGCLSKRTMAWQKNNRERYNKYIREYNKNRKKSTQNTSV